MCVHWCVCNCICLCPVLAPSFAEQIDANASSEQPDEALICLLGKHIRPINKFTGDNGGIIGRLHPCIDPTLTSV